MSPDEIIRRITEYEGRDDTLQRLISFVKSGRVNSLAELGYRARPGVNELRIKRAPTVYDLEEQ